MFKKVVVPLDGSSFAERAIAPAVTVAHQAGVPLELVSCRIGRVAFGPRKYFQAVADRAGLQSDDIRIMQPEPRLSDGQNVARLLRVAIADDETLVCMTSHTRSGLQEAVFGTIADYLIRHVDATFLVVGPRCEVSADWRVDRMLVCSDGSEVAHAIVPVAGDWFRALRPTACIVQVVTPEADDAVRAAAGDVSDQSVTRAIARELGGESRVRWDLLHSEHPGRAIVEYAQSLGASLIAMSTHGRSGLARVTTGSVTGDVLRHARCPVLIVRPHLDEAKP